jgi:hypothetical protein
MKLCRQALRDATTVQRLIESACATDHYPRFESATTSATTYLVINQKNMRGKQGGGSVKIEHYQQDLDRSSVMYHLHSLARRVRPSHGPPFPSTSRFREGPVSETSDPKNNIWD